MWNKLAQIRQDPSFKRLLLALCVSALVHVWLAGGFSFKSLAIKKQPYLIQAQLQIPKAATEKLELPKPVETITPKQATLIKRAHKKQTQQKPPPVEPVLPPVSDTFIDLAATEPAPQIEALPSAALPQPVNAALALNENAYQYVETEFEVRTELDGAAVGKVKITYNLNDNQQYRLTLLEAHGNDTLASPSLMQTSEGWLTKTGLQPTTYQYQLGGEEDKNSSANFDWQAKKITLQTSQIDKTTDLPDGTQDLLTALYQFMYIAPAQNLQFLVANGQELSHYDFKIEGEEITLIGLGEIKTVHLAHSDVATVEKTELWLAIDFQYIPVKIRKIATNGNMVELLASSIIVNRPTTVDSQPSSQPNVPLNKESQ